MTLKSLTNQSCLNKVEWFCRMRDFICARNGTYDYTTTGIGWTLHDSSYVVDENNPDVNDWIVIYSSGESGKDDLYFKITFKSGDMLFQGYLYWDNVGHAGVHPYNTTDNIIIADTEACLLFVSGDLDFVNCWETINHATYDYCVFFGILENLPADNTVATSSAALASGADVIISLDAVPASWIVGQKIYIRDTTSVEIITIKTITGNDITADLVTAYDTGVKLQADLGYFCNNTGNTFRCYMIAGRSSSAAVSASSAYVALGTNADPDALTGKHTGIYIHILGGDAYYGTIRGMYFSTYTGLTIGDAFTAGGKNYRYQKYGTFHVMVLEA